MKLRLILIVFTFVIPVANALQGTKAGIQHY
jgi:hypothetical protein